MPSTRSWPTPSRRSSSADLGEYKYYDMDQVIAAVLDRCESELH